MTTPAKRVRFDFSGTDQSEDHSDDSEVGEPSGEEQETESEVINCTSIRSSESVSS